MKVLVAMKPESFYLRKLRTKEKYQMARAFDVQAREKVEKKVVF